MAVISSRLADDVTETNELFQCILECMRRNKKIPEKKRNSSFNFAKLTIDISDFYLYNRIFLDTLAACVALSFKDSKSKNAWLLGYKLNFYLDPNKIEIYKKEIDEDFFNGLQKQLIWVNDFRKTRDDLVHYFSHFVFTTTEDGELGYDLLNHMKEQIWGTNTVKGILTNMQMFIDKLTALLVYLETELPKRVSEI